MRGVGFVRRRSEREQAYVSRRIRCCAFRVAERQAKSDLPRIVANDAEFRVRIVAFQLLDDLFDFHVILPFRPGRDEPNQNIERTGYRPPLMLSF